MMGGLRNQSILKCCSTLTTFVSVTPCCLGSGGMGSVADPTGWNVMSVTTGSCPGGASDPNQPCSIS